MALEQDPNYNALSWVQAEIQKTLEDASNELTAYTLNSDDQTHLVSFVGQLHQIVGTIEMLNLPGAMMLATEMQTLSLSLRDQECPNPSSAQEALSHAIEVFENYLAILEAGGEDHPLKLIDIINKLRESYNAEPIKAASLLPDVSKIALPDTLTSQNITSSQLSNDQAIKLRHAFQKSLLLWFQNDDAHALIQLGNVIHHLRLSCAQEEAIKLWWVAGGLVEAIAQNGVGVTNEIKLLVGRLSQPIKFLTEEDEDSLLSKFPDELLNSMLLLVAKANSHGMHVSSLKQNFKLNFFDRYQHQKIYGLETEEDDENRSMLFNEIEQAKALISENEFEEAISDETTSQLMAYFNNMASLLESLSETTTANFIKEELSNTSVASSEGSTLAPFVDTILQIETTLQGSNFNQSGDSFTADLRQLQGPVVKECLLELSRIKDTLTIFSKQPEDNLETLNEPVMQLELMSGSLSMLNYANSANLLSSTASVMNKMLTETKSINDEQLALLAESIAAIEVFLEGIIQHGNPLDKVISDAQEKLDLIEAPSTISNTNIATTITDIEIPTFVTANNADAQEDEIKTPSFSDEIDPEIAEIFIEEAEEVLEDLQMLIPAWKQQQDSETLTTIRRHFHTLKGSGRMAGATVIGELSWEIEELLNKVINDELESNQNLSQLVEDTCALVPKLITQFESGQSDITDDVAFLLTKARALTKVEIAEPEADQDELQVIFNMEAAQQLKTLDQEIPSTPGENILINKDMLRATHSLKGCANIAGITLVAPAATQLDQTLRKLYENRQAIEGGQVQLFEQILADLSATVEHIKDSQQSLPDLTQLEANIALLIPEGLKEAAEETSEFALDPDFLAVFMDESDDLLTEYMENAKTWFHNPEDDNATDALHESLLALTEGAEVADIASMRDIYLQMGRLVTQSSATDSKCLALLDVAHEELNKQIESLLQGQVAPTLNSFNAQVDDFLSANKVEKTTSVEAKEETFEIQTDNEELLEAFIEEAVELLTSSGNAIKRWEKSPDDQIALTQLQRSLHTLKGGARLTNIAPVADLTHQMETLVLAGVDKEVSELDSDFFGLLHRCQDQLSDMQDHLIQHQPLQYASNLSADIARFTATEPTEPASIPAPLVEKGPSTKETEAPAHVEQIRVRADLLDYLSNFAGEVSISRDRVSQQNVAVRTLLNEMEQTVTRLQEQLRNMEIETETQILFRYEDENTDTNVDFDPLELDRFSMIQQLSRGLTESVSDLNDIRQSMDDIVRDTDTILLQQSRINTELQEGLMGTRLLPFDGIVPRLERIVRQTSNTLEKQSELTVFGASQELDRTVLDRITAPIEHLLRNAIAHGIETPEERRASGKSESGNITLSIKREGPEIVFDISDDGQGINVDKIRKIAVGKGLIETEQELTDHELIQFILTSGFSTSDEVSQLSGRGIGMDVVASEIRAVKGRLTIDSTKGVGTTFHIRLPLTLSVIQALLVGCHDQLYAIPLSSASNVEKTTSKEREALLKTPDAQYEYKGESYRFLPLATLLDQAVETEDVSEYQPILLFRSGDQRIALLVSHIESNREIVIKSLGTQLGTIAPLTGATILGDGQVAFILDIPTLASSMPAILADIPAIETQTEQIADTEVVPTVPIAMIVDDSITMRKASGNLLLRHGFEVITARDGIDAVAKIHEQKPDIILLDVEMPRMDGYEFATLVRNDAEFKDLPIIMITSRTGDKHRQRAMDLGVNAYLGKPYPETELIENMQQLLGERYPHAHH